jgi:hypothetical protein
MRRVSSVGWIVLASGLGAGAANLPAVVCPLAVHEAQVELEDAELEARLARSGFAAYESIFALIEGLLQAEAVDKMTYLRARYDRDAARLALERADLLLARQAATVEQYRLACGTAGDGARARTAAEADAYRRYLQADCDQQAKAIEVARTNLEFNTSYRDSILDLRQGQVATRQEVILAELDVEQETLRLADARARAESCRSQLAKLADGKGG